MKWYSSEVKLGMIPQKQYGEMIEHEIMVLLKIKPGHDAWVVVMEKDDQCCN